MTLVNRDEEHLRLLSILHYVWGGLTVMLSCLGFLYMFGGVIFAAMAGRHEEAPAWLGLIFVLVGGFVVLLGWTTGGLTIWAGRCLATKRHYIFCIVIAALSCLSMPFGTALGVFTLIVLSRPSVKQSFSPAQPAAAAP